MTCGLRRNGRHRAVHAQRVRPPRSALEGAHQGNKDKWVRDNFLAERGTEGDRSRKMRRCAIQGSTSTEMKARLKSAFGMGNGRRRGRSALCKSEQTCNLAREDVEGDKCKWDKDYEVCRPRYMNDCSQAYMNFFCFLNFPRCDEYENSLILCKSVCENYFISCGYSERWRCGPSEF